MKYPFYKSFLAQIPEITEGERFAVRNRETGYYLRSMMDGHDGYRMAIWTKSPLRKFTSGIHLLEFLRKVFDARRPTDEILTRYKTPAQRVRETFRNPFLYDATHLDPKGLKNHFDPAEWEIVIRSGRLVSGVVVPSLKDIADEIAKERTIMSEFGPAVFDMLCSVRERDLSGIRFALVVHPAPLDKIWYLGSHRPHHDSIKEMLGVLGKNPRAIAKRSVWYTTAIGVHDENDLVLMRLAYRGPHKISFVDLENNAWFGEETN